MSPHISLSSLAQYLLTALLTSVTCIVATALFQLSRKTLSGYRSALHVLPGPKSISWISGSISMKERREPLEIIEDWSEEYGHTFAFRSFLNKYELFTADLKALTHIMSHPNEFPKPDELRRVLGNIIGDGLLVTEGVKHRHQRKVMNPAFGPVQIRELTSIMVQKSQELCDVLRAQFADAKIPASGDKAKAQIDVDILSWLNKATLDIIGLAGFGYSFDALHATEDNPNELNAAINKVFALPENLFADFKVFAPILRHIPTQEQRDQNHSMRTMRRIGNELLAQKKAAVRAESSAAVAGRDLLSLLIKANMAPDLAESTRMDDEDVLSQVPTFLMAGHETTSTGTSWALFALATHPVVQTKLRAELLSQSTENPTMDELNALPYLDAVVRESLRRYPPVQSTVRLAAEDTVIPLDEPVVGRDGVKRHEITVSKDDWMVIPIHLANTSKELWAKMPRNLSKPERWLTELPEAVHSIPSIYSSLLTFISGGRACIGYRFAITEMKALLFSLIRSFEFELGVPKEDISYKTFVVMRPTVKSQKERGFQLPMIMRPVTVD